MAFATRPEDCCLLQVGGKSHMQTAQGACCRKCRLLDCVMCYWSRCWQTWRARTRSCCTGTSCASMAAPSSSALMSWEKTQVRPPGLLPYLLYVLANDMHLA